MVNSRIRSPVRTVQKLSTDLVLKEFTGQQKEIKLKAISIEEINNTRCCIADDILSRLIVFKEHGPHRFQYMDEKQTEEVIDDMIYAFSYYADRINVFEKYVDYTRIREGLRVFGFHIGQLVCNL